MTKKQYFHGTIIWLLFLSFHITSLFVDYYVFPLSVGFTIFGMLRVIDCGFMCNIWKYLKMDLKEVNKIMKEK